MPTHLRTILSLVILLTFLGKESFSQECDDLKRKQCTYYRLDESGPWGVPNSSSKTGTMQNIPKKDQRERGYCYAFTATDMFEAIYQAENPEFKDFPLVSPVHTAFQYAENKNFFLRIIDNLNEKLTGDGIAEGGDTCAAVNLLLEKGYCPQAEVDKNNVLYESVNWLVSNKRNLIATKKALKKMGRATSKNIDIVQLKYNADLLERNLKKYPSLTLCKNEPSVAAFRKFVGDMSDLLSYESTRFDELENLYNEYLKNYCSQNLKRLGTNKYSCVKEDFRNTADLKDFFIKNKERFSSILSDQISNPPVLPIELSICGGALNGGLETKRLAVSFGVQPTKDCGPHTVTVMGRKWDESKCACKLLVKNSWGPLSCFYQTEKAAEKIQVLEGRKRWLGYAKRGWECDDKESLFWANQDDIFENTLSISYISKEKK